jgi:SAM-dependent methyltransferase
LLPRIQNTLASPQRFQRMRDYFYSQVLYTIPISFRKRFFRGTRRYCPVCECHLNTFLVLHRSYHLWCPICSSLQRHRLVILYLLRKTDLFSPPVKKMLHFAPEKGLSARFKSSVYIEYISADLYDQSAAVKMDISQIQFSDQTFDVIYCSHVLEHVADDRKAMAELIRVLKTGGWALILVPITHEHTLEDSSISKFQDRERLFGQFDHVRSYGVDFSNRLITAGFEVRKIQTGDVVEPEEISYMGLLEDETLFLCRKPK